MHPLGRLTGRGAACRLGGQARWRLEARASAYKVLLSEMPSRTSHGPGCRAVMSLSVPFFISVLSAQREALFHPQPLQACGHPGNGQWTCRVGNVLSVSSVWRTPACPGRVGRSLCGDPCTRPPWVLGTGVMRRSSRRERPIN